MTRDYRLPGPIIWTVAGTLVAIAGLVLPQWVWGASAASVADDVPIIAIVFVSLYGQTSLAGVGQAQRLVVAFTSAVVQALAVGLAAYALYAVGRPELLTARYAARLAAATPAQAEQLRQGMAHWLSPAEQALNSAQTVLVAGFLVSGFVAFRARVAQRRQASS